MENKYKECLEEIKKIIDFECKVDCKHNIMCICNVCDIYDEILEKIDKVL